ncbi:hypothetical protein MJO28_009519 [Puccinia striiformis f. sp. tritici]|uniref:Uncharacterized protein n=1 Tax=Puccinia striiformis f. sp. tritici TaxID=168172 RepID=A0ACC0E7C4_9BASI|nr:hypothetical protein MJO28_009519 [Puccinia striiformis f. sp. tritici]
MSYGLPGSFDDSDASTIGGGATPTPTSNIQFNLPTTRATSASNAGKGKESVRTATVESESEDERTTYRENNIRNRTEGSRVEGSRMEGSRAEGTQAEGFRREGIRTRIRRTEVPVDDMDVIEERTYRSNIKKKIVKIENDSLKFEGEKFNTFLSRYERTADACGASDWDKVMQIDKFVVGEDLKEELESMEGYEKRDWDTLKKSMKEVWADLFPRMKHTIQDLHELAEECVKKGGIKDVKSYKIYASKFMTIVKYLLNNEHISSSRDVFSADGYCKPPDFADLLQFTEKEMKAGSDDAFGYGRAFAESSRVIQQGLDLKKGSEKGKVLREKMIEENPSSKLEEKVDSMAKGIAALQQKLEKPDTNYTDANPRGNAPLSRTLYDSKTMVCYYCSKEGHGTTKCQDLEADERLGLIPYDASRPIRTVVATASAKVSAKPVVSKVAFVEDYKTEEKPTENQYRDSSRVDSNIDEAISCLNSIEWDPPVLNSDNYGRVRFQTNGMTTRAEALRGRRRETRIEEVGEDEMDVDSEEATVEKEKAPEPTKVKSTVKEEKRPETLLANELENMKIPTTFSQLTALSPVYAEEIIRRLSRKLPEQSKTNISYISKPNREADSRASMLLDKEHKPKDPSCFYSCALGYILTKVLGGTIEFMVDSGSMVNVIPSEVALAFGMEVVKVEIPMKGVGGGRCDITGVVENCPITVGRFTGPVHLFVAPSAVDCILGRPFLFDYDCTLEYPDVGEMLSFQGENGRRVTVPLVQVGVGRGWNKRKPMEHQPEKEESHTNISNNRFKEVIIEEELKPVHKSGFKKLKQTFKRMFSLPKTRLRKNDSSLSFGEVVPSASGIRNWNSETRRNSLIRKIDNLVASQEEQKDTEEEISAVKVNISDISEPFLENQSFNEEGTDELLCNGLGIATQTEICDKWKNGEMLCLTKYKPVAKKVRPVNQPIPQNLNPPLQRPALSRNPYETPLTPNPPEFEPTEKITEERIKVIDFGPEGWLLPEELKLFLWIIVSRAGALAFRMEERGLLKHSYGLPYVIPVVEHVPWQKKPIPIPAAIKEEFTELVWERVNTGLYEQSTSSYSSPVFCVAKHDGKWRIVHDLQEMNKVTIKDAGLPPATEEFVESFAGRACYGLGDIMGGYDERELAEESRPLTTFDTPIGRFQLTRLPQGATNSVAVYQAQMMWILQDEIPEHVGVFIDDGGIKGPRTDYDGEVLEENKGIRRFIWEYAVVLERVLFRIEEAGLTISGKKFACCVPALDIVGHVVCKEGRTVSRKKKNKVLTWPTPQNVTELKGFLGVVTYVRIFIENLSEIASPLRKLTRKDEEWNWTDECDAAFKRLKILVGQDITLKKLDFSEGAGEITLAVDSSFVAAGAVLSQEDLETGLSRPVLYESIVFSPVESRYSQPKLELCGVARILKKLQTTLWGQHFKLQVDAKSLVQMISSPSLPNAPMTRWVAFIQLFSFDIEHKPGKTFTLPDGLSRRPISSDEEEYYEDQPDFDEEEALIRPCFNLKILRNELEIEVEDWEEKGFWTDMKSHLETPKKPSMMDAEEFAKLRRKSVHFFVQEGRLMRRHSPVAQLVVSNEVFQDKILTLVHAELGHRGLEETYTRVVHRFWWPSLKKKVKMWVKSCEPCQKRDSLVPREIRNPTGESSLFGRVALDVCHIKAGRYKYVVVARDDLSGWVEAAPLVKLSSASIAKFLVEEWVYRYGSIKTVTVNNGAEFKDSFIEAVKTIGAEFKPTTPYYPEANGMVERGHRPIKDTLVKMCGESGGKWREFLPLVLFADRISTKRSTGYSPYEIVFGQKAVLPIDLEAETYLGIDWMEVLSTEELLEARTKQLERREEILEEAHQKMMETREYAVRYWDQKMASRLREPLEPGELVLIYNKSLEDQWGKLFSNRWNGPYRIKKQLKGGAYILEELDGVELRRAYAASHIKRFYPRGRDAVEIFEEELDESESLQEHTEGSIQDIVPSTWLKNIISD